MLPDWHHRNLYRECPPTVTHCSHLSHQTRKWPWCTPGINQLTGVTLCSTKQEWCHLIIRDCVKSRTLWVKISLQIVNDHLTIKQGTPGCMSFAYLKKHLSYLIQIWQVWTKGYAMSNLVQFGHTTHWIFLLKSKHGSKQQQGHGLRALTSWLFLYNEMQNVGSTACPALELWIRILIYLLKMMWVRTMIQ